MSVSLVYTTAIKMLPVVILMVASVAHAMAPAAFLETESHALVRYNIIVIVVID